MRYFGADLFASRYLVYLGGGAAPAPPVVIEHPVASILAALSPRATVRPRALLGSIVALSSKGATMAGRPAPVGTMTPRVYAATLTPPPSRSATLTPRPSPAGTVTPILLAAAITASFPAATLTPVDVKGTIT